MIDIVIPTYNNADQLVCCLKSLTRNIEYPYTIHVINNGDVVDNQGVGFDEYINGLFPEGLVNVHNMGENKGWEGALNYAYKELVESPYMMALNDDVVFIPWHRTFIRQMAEYFQFEDVGAIGPVSNVVMGSQNFVNHEMPMIHKTSLLIGFCCLYKVEALRKISVDETPWDESLPGGDDFDISIRLEKAGYNLLVDRSAYLHHIGFQTGQRVKGSEWNSTRMRIATDNALMEKHGVKAWFHCMQSYVEDYKPITPSGDEEGDWIRDKVEEGWKGLDLGVGANKTIEQAIGVDRVAKDVIGLSGGRRGVPSVAEVNADVTDLPFDDESQDFIVARHLLEHIVDLAQVFTEWRRVLKPEGVLLIACPNQNKTDTMTLDSEHVHAFTPESLTPLLMAYGFDPIEVLDVPSTISFCVMSKKAPSIEKMIFETNELQTQEV